MTSTSIIRLYWTMFIVKELFSKTELFYWTVMQLFLSSAIYRRTNIRMSSRSPTADMWNTIKKKCLCDLSGINVTHSRFNAFCVVEYFFLQLFNVMLKLIKTIQSELRVSFIYIYVCIDIVKLLQHWLPT